METNPSYSRGEISQCLTFWPIPSLTLSAIFYAGSSMIPGCRELGHSMPNFTASSMSSVRNSEASLLTSKQGHFSDWWTKLKAMTDTQCISSFTYLSICLFFRHISVRTCNPNLFLNLVQEKNRRIAYNVGHWFAYGPWFKKSFPKIIPGMPHFEMEGG